MSHSLLARWLRPATATVLAACLAACATESKYRAYVDQWKGVDELELVRHWGPPEQSYVVQGHKFLAFAARRNSYVPGPPPLFGGPWPAWPAYVGSTPGSWVTFSCKTVFELENDHVISTRWEGNDCVAP